MDMLDKDLETAAEQCAGNWKDFESFSYAYASDEDSENWCIYPSLYKGEGLIAQSNDAVIRTELSKFGADVREERHSHWGPGYVDSFVIRVYDENRNITEAFKEFHSLMLCLFEYPLLDDSDHSQREYDAALEAINNVAPIFLEEEDAKKIFSWLWANEQMELEDVDDQGPFPSKEAVMRAMYALGLAQHEEENE